jgi:hypothetical protein
MRSRDPGWKKFGYGINIPDPQHCCMSTLLSPDGVDGYALQVRTGAMEKDTYTLHVYLLVVERDTPLYIHTAGGKIKRIHPARPCTAAVVVIHDIWC